MTLVWQGNHVQLAEEGVIPALIELAKTECPVVRRNCASALRSMTCKAEVRQLLIASGAIKVILDDATNQVRVDTAVVGSTKYLFWRPMDANVSPTFPPFSTTYLKCHVQPLEFLPSSLSGTYN